ncbi:hypothetical protein ES703_39635 [subsurface metagenome]
MGKKRVQVTFSRDQWNMIKKLKSEMGATDSDVVRNIIIAWLAEKSFITTYAKNKVSKGR